eukprot:tig00020941_g16230.t1
MGNSQKKKAPEVEVTDQDRAVLDLKVQRDKLKQYRKRVETLMEQESAVAMQLLREKKKDRALLALRRKKYQEQLLQKTEAIIMNLEQMVNSIEFAQMQARVVESMKEGNAALKAIQAELSVDSIERLMEDTEESLAKQREIDEVLCRNLRPEDDAAAERELQRIEQELLSGALPSVPSGAVAATAAASSAVAQPQRPQQPQQRIALPAS